MYWGSMMISLGFDSMMSATSIEGVSRKDTGRAVGYIVVGRYGWQVINFPRIFCHQVTSNEMISNGNMSDYKTNYEYLLARC